MLSTIRDICSERDVSLVNSEPELKNSLSKFDVVCNKCGYESSTCFSWFRKAKLCLKCSDRLPYSTEEWIEKAKSVHGDRFDYSKVVYKTAKNKVTITCGIHGDFEQYPRDHINGCGCKWCSNSNEDRRLGKEEFIKRAREVHGDRYDYSKVKYISYNNPVTISCQVHGEFKQSPAAHIHQKQGCKWCSGNYKYAFEDFLEKSKNKHGNKYFYSECSFKSLSDVITIFCKEHGGFFEQLAKQHITGRGCSVCRYSYFDEFVRTANKLHNGKYTYLPCDYQNRHSVIPIICPEHGEFKQKARNHLKSGGCPNCSNHGYNPEKPGAFYIQKVSDGDCTYLKYGITNRKAKTRLTEITKTSSFDHTLLYEFRYEDGRIPYGIESIVKKNIPSGVVDKTLLPDGFTETCDLTYLDDILSIVDEYHN